jgi:hypothetical protein
MYRDLHALCWGYAVPRQVRYFQFGLMSMVVYNRYRYCIGRFRCKIHGAHKYTKCTAEGSQGTILCVPLDNSVQKETGPELLAMSSLWKRLIT